MPTRDLPNIDLNIPLLKDLYIRATAVVAWYAHPTQVRGPFVRWFEITEVEERYRSCVASRADDAAYCAAAMNSVPHLIKMCEDLHSKLHRITDILGSRHADLSPIEIQCYDSAIALLAESKIK